ncbi:MAG: ATP-binding protein [Candidatus Riflebacteria bacterium]|nr:ATP-binding protein [Candidatus Riflebacteria bacterium]
MRKKLSTSIYTFKTIIEGNAMYVDKTKEIYKLISTLDGQFFLARPRRFGKSLTLSTLESFFLGEKELFKGLYIYDQPCEWKKHPIIRLSMNSISSSNADELENKLSSEIDMIAEKSAIKLSLKTSDQKFKELISLLFDHIQKPVILIDEYDKPILDNILDTEEVLKIRALLKKFYGIIKACERNLRFTFITGVSKFTQVSIFSDLNNLDDITMIPDFATLCGFTQEECERYFAEWIEENAVKNEMTKIKYLEKIKETYDGIRFTEKDVTVYNPVSFTKAMEQGNFNHYWFETGTPSFLIKLLKDRDYNIIEFENLRLNSDDFSTYEVDNLKVEALLYQTGYLTIKKYQKDAGIYTLSYPNREVREAFVKYLVDYFTPVSKSKTASLVDDFRKAIQENNINDAFEVLNVFYSKIDYSIKIKREKYYQTIFYIFFSLLGYHIKTEVNTNKGRMDAVLYTDKHIYIFEFKLNKPVIEALDQIKKREYYQQFLKDSRELVLAGVSFNSETGEIKEWKIESTSKQK